MSGFDFLFCVLGAVPNSTEEAAGKAVKEAEDRGCVCCGESSASSEDSTISPEKVTSHCASH